MICSACDGENEDDSEVCFHCRAVLLPVTRGAVLVERYEIQSVLGRGGMGTVYKAHDRVLDEAVAIKLLRAELAGDPEHARRFRAELKLARKVSHRNVCRIHEYAEDQGFRFISMEFIDGDDLKHVVQRQGGLPPDEAFDVVIQIAQGLEAIHEVGIVHRDLKTINIRRDSRGVVKVMDFGIAKQLGREATTGATATGQIVGTPEYMSPEQARGEKADFRSDIYALGVVAYEIFSGHVPFKGDSPVATLFMHTQTAPPLEGPVAARIPAPLVPVLWKALAKDPRARQPSASRLALEIRAARAAFSRGEARADIDGVGLEDPTLSLAVRRRRLGQLALAAAGLAGAVALYLARSSPPAGVVMPEAPLRPIATAATATPPAAVPTAAPTAAATLPRIEAAPRATVAPPPPPAVAPSPAAPTSTAEPAAVPAAGPTVPPEATASASPAAAAEERGVLQLVVVPFAEVTIDDVDLGRVSSSKFPLAPGSHVVVFAHPDYQPVRRKITILPGSTEKLVVDLAEDAIARKK